MIQEEDYKIEIQIKNLINKVLEDDFTENTSNTLTQNEIEGINTSLQRKNKNITNNFCEQTNSPKIDTSNHENLNIKRSTSFIPQSNLIFSQNVQIQDFSNFQSESKTSYGVLK